MSSKKGGRKTNSFASHTFRDDDRVGFNAYPEELPVYLSHTVFPTSAHVNSALDLPLGMMARPFITNAQQQNYKGSAAISKAVKDIARCEHCAAYINAFCDVNPGRWFCSLCGKRNHYMREQLRYKHIDPRLLPELRDLLMDYIAPVKEDGNAIYYAVPIEKRPLIHFFLIQEDMEVDTLQTVIDAINTATATMHPDIHVVLMTFSYRIGIFTLHGDNPHAGVQYVHYVHEESGDCLESVVEEHNSVAAVDMSAYSVQPALVDLSRFQDASCPVGECRDSLGACLSSILDGIPTNTNVDTNRNYQTLSHTLQAIQAWIRGHPSNNSNTNNNNNNSTSATTASSSSNNNHTDENTGLNAFDFSKIWSLLGSQPGEPTAAGRKHQVRNSHEHRITTNEYSGILLHVFMDRAQHNEHSPTTKQLTELITDFSNLSVQVNFWAVCAFESHEIGGYFWNELVTKTGGMFTRHTLGVQHPTEEQLHLTQQLTRRLTMPYATKCQLKIRTSPALLVPETGRSGLFQAVGNTVGQDVYEIPVVSPDTTYAFPFAFDANHTAMLSTDPNNAYHRDGSNIEAVGIQIVFAYETIKEAQDGVAGEEEESPHADNNNNNNNNNNVSTHQHHQHGDKYTAANMRMEEYDQSRYLKDVLDMLGMDLLRMNLSQSRDALDASPGSSSTKSTSHVQKKQLIANVKRLFDNRIAATMLSPSNSGKNHGNSTYTKLRTLSPYNANKPLVVTRYVRVITLAIECNRDVRIIQQSADDSVCSALMIREALMANRLNHALRASPPSSSPATTGNGAEMSYSAQQTQTLASQLQQSLHGESILINYIVRMLWMQVDAMTTETDQNKTGSELRSRYDELLIIAFQQSHIQHLLPVLYIAVMKLLEGKESDATLEWMHTMLTYGPFLTYRLLYPALQGVSWQVNDSHGGIQSMERSDILPLRRDALVTMNMPYYLLDAAQELVLYHALINGKNTVVEAGELEDNARLGGDTNQSQQDQQKETEKQLQDIQDEKSKLYFVDSLITRLYEHPIVPRVLLSTAGTASSAYFTAHFGTDNTSNQYMISYEDFRLFMLDILMANSSRK